MGPVILIIFIIEIIILSVSDRILFGTYFTPITILSVPYLFIVILAISIGPSLGFVSFYYPSLWIWIIGLPFFWIPGLILATGFLKETNINNYPYSVTSNIQLDNIILSLTYFIIAILTYELLTISNKSAIGTDEFELAFGGGIPGHSLLVSRFLIIYLIVTFKRKYILPLILLLCFSISYGVKSWIFIPLFSGLLIRILLQKTKFTISLISKGLLIGLSVFYVVYRIALGSDMPILFVFSQFMKYIFSGVLGLSEYIRLENEVGFDPLVIINPVINIYNKVLGSGDLYNFKDILTYIGIDSDTNTKTFFGTIYIYSGPLWGSLFLLIFGTIVYSFLILSIKTKNMIFLIIYGTFLTMCFFGWFDNYSGNLFFYEFPTFGIFLFLFYTTISKMVYIAKE